MGGGQALFVWLVATWGEGGGQVAIIVSYFESFLLCQEVVGVAAQQFRDFLHVFSATALQSLLVVLCGGPPDMVDTVRQSLEDLSQDVENPQQYQTSLGFTVLHCRQGAEVLCPPKNICFFYCGFLNSGAFSGQSDAETG